MILQATSKRLAGQSFGHGEAVRTVPIFGFRGDCVRMCRMRIFWQSAWQALLLLDSAFAGFGYRSAREQNLTEMCRLRLAAAFGAWEFLICPQKNLPTRCAVNVRAPVVVLAAAPQTAPAVLPPVRATYTRTFMLRGCFGCLARTT